MACQEAWEVRRTLLEVQGQLQMLQKDMAEVLESVGLFKVRDEKGNLKGKRKDMGDGLRKAHSEAQLRIKVGKFGLFGVRRVGFLGLKPGRRLGRVQVSMMGLGRLSPGPIVMGLGMGRAYLSPRKVHETARALIPCVPLSYIASASCWKVCHRRRIR